MEDPQIKIWGNTTEIFRNTSCTVHYLEIKKGGYCSEHRHARKSNVFYIISGILQITEWYDDGKHFTLLKPGDHFVIPVKRWHKFRAMVPVKCVEMYNFEYDGDDIERRCEGGIG